MQAENERHPAKNGGRLALDPAATGGDRYLPPRLPEREGYDIQPERAALQKSVPIAGLFYIPPKKREWGVPPVIIGTKRKVHISKPKAGAPCDKQ